MTSIRAIEYRIIQDLLERREVGVSTTGSAWAGRLISGVAVCAGMLLLGSVLQELLWVLLSAAVVLVLGTPGGD